MKLSPSEGLAYSLIKMHPELRVAMGFLEPWNIWIQITVLPYL